MLSFPAKPTIPYAGRVFDEDEVEAAVSATLDFWLTLGPEGEAFEEELAEVLGVKRSLLVNSGSSANLLPFRPHQPQARRPPHSPRRRSHHLRRRFPTTVAPIIQNGAVPVFLDNDPLTLNARPRPPGRSLRARQNEGGDDGPHAGQSVRSRARSWLSAEQHDLWLIEDNCDALGSTYTLPGRAEPKLTGTFGDLSTQSFYPPHHLTLGEGGAVNIVRDMRLKVLVESFRDWGRDCWCASGKDNTCGKRFGWQLGELPEGYDHKYIYSHLGYNLKPLDIQAAIGRQQLKKLPAFSEARRENWEYLRRGLADLEEFFEFHLPTHATGWTPEGFTWESEERPALLALLVRLHAARAGPARPSPAPSSPGTSMNIASATACSSAEICCASRLSCSCARTGRRRCAFSAKCPGADRIMNESIFVGVYPGLTRAMLDYMIETISTFCRKA